MKFLAQELSCINYALNVKPDGTQRTFTVAELPDVNDIAVKLVNSTKEDAEGKLFIDSELEFSSAQKVFITRLVSEANWTAIQGEFVLTLLAKIK